MLLTTEPNLSLSGVGYKQALVLRVAQRNYQGTTQGPPSDCQVTTKGRPRVLPLPVRPPTSTASHHYHWIFGGFPMRPSRRAPDELRAVSLERGVVKYAEGSCMVKFGDTHVLVTATLEERQPHGLDYRRMGRFGRLHRLDEGPQHDQGQRPARQRGRDILRYLQRYAGARPRLRRGFGSRYRRQFCHDRRWTHHRGAGHRRKDAVLAGRIPGADGAGAQGRGAAGGPAEDGRGVSSSCRHVSRTRLPV